MSKTLCELLLSLLFVSRASCGPLCTIPTPTEKSLEQRGFSADASSLLGSIPTDVAGGILPAFENLPDPKDVQSKLNISDDQVSQLPLAVLNIPGYANFTSSAGWTLRIHGQAYKQLPATDEQTDALAKVFLPGLDQSQLNSSQLAESRNVTSALFALPQGGVTLNFTLKGNNETLQQFTFPAQTDDRGEFDMFVLLNVSVTNKTNTLRHLDLFTDGVDSGNSSAWLVPPQGISLVSDIDDITRFTQIYDPDAGLRNSFGFPYTPWLNMPTVIGNWTASIPGFHIHWLTTTPEQFTRVYEQFTFANYPQGSFDTRPLNFTTIDQTFSIRKVNLIRFFETFPQRKIVLLADTSNSDIMKDYPLMGHMFPNQVQCILMRNTSSTDSSDHFPYDTSGFAGLDPLRYFFFNIPDDIAKLDIANGQCVNTSISQNVTFGEQGLPFGLGDTSTAVHFAPWTSLFWGCFFAALGLMIEGF